MMKATFTMIRRYVPSLAIAGVLALAGSTAWGQQAAGGDGRALDANPNAAGPGNDPQGQVDYRARNEIITGEVGGGRAFQGDVGYTAPGSFQGRTGGDDLFRFRADSLPAAPGQAPRVYRPYSVPEASQRPGAVSPEVNIGGYTGVQRGQRPWGQAPTVDEFGLDTDTRGRTLEAGRARFDVRFDAIPGVGEPGRSLERQDRSAFQPRLDEDLWDRDLFRDPRYRLERQRDMDLDWLEDRSLRDLPGLEDDQHEWQPSLFLGQQLQSQLDPQLRTGTERMRDIETLHQRLYNPLEDAHADDQGQDAYLDLLGSIRERSQRFTIPEEQLGARRPQADEETEVDELEQWERELEERLEQAEEAGQEPDEEDLTLQERIREAQEDEDADPAQILRQQDPDADPDQPVVLEELLNELDYDLPALDTLAGDEATPVNELMNEAELHLAEGDYFEAEQLYRRALRQEADRPLARVGMIHAQLGAGMMRSAVLNLRRLFEAHPELIAARYEDNLLPSEQRRQWLENELRQTIEEEAAGTREAAIMLAYLGYQTESDELIRDGLEAAREHAPSDPLVVLLRRIWIEGEAAPEQDLELTK